MTGKSGTRDRLPSNLPAQVPLAALRRAPQEFVAEVAASAWPRLAAALACPEGHLEVRLTVGRDATSGLRASGSVAGELWLECQRCLRGYPQPLQFRIDARLVFSDAEELQRMREEEVWRVHGEALELREQVEDEVLLALPLVPRCTAADCGDVTGT